MNLILLGPPGVGKGTQALDIAKNYDIPHISMGDILRENVKKGTELGIKAKEYMDQGKLVPNELVMSIAKDRLTKEDVQTKGFLLDGYPRNIGQAEQLEKDLVDLNLKIDYVINLNAPDDTLVERISGRRICKSCGASFHTIFNAPKKEGVCDECGGELYQRDDDKVETVKKRIEVYNNETEPLIKFYEDKNLLIDIDGTKAISEVFADIVERLSK